MADRVTAVGEQTSLADRKRRAGQRLILGFEGRAVTDDLRHLVAEVRPAGFILFQRNVESPEQVRELNRELASLVDPAAPAWLTVDQEGGREQRVRAPAPEWPPMRAVGAAPGHTVEVSRALARELRAMGFNLNYAPVADVDSNPDNPVIGDRAFDRDPMRVAQHVVDFIGAHQAEGVVACAKHFPGHGDTAVDSHLDLPVVERDEAELRALELPPFRAAVQARVGTVMVSHVVFPAWDPDHPATLSKRIVPRLLRDELGYDGVVLSDDMEMKAVAGRWSVEEQVHRGTDATLDVFLVCHQPALQLAFFEALVRGQETHPAFERHSVDAARRVHALRERFLLERPAPVTLAEVGAEAHRDLALRVQARAQA